MALSSGMLIALFLLSYSGVCAEFQASVVFPSVQKNLASESLPERTLSDLIGFSLGLPPAHDDSASVLATHGASSIFDKPKATAFVMLDGINTDDLALLPESSVLRSQAAGVSSTCSSASCLMASILMRSPADDATTLTQDAVSNFEHPQIYVASGDPKLSQLAAFGSVKPAVVAYDQRAGRFTESAGPSSPSDAALLQLLEPLVAKHEGTLDQQADAVHIKMGSWGASFDRSSQCFQQMAHEVLSMDYLASRQEETTAQGPSFYVVAPTSLQCMDDHSADHKRVAMSLMNGVVDKFLSGLKNQYNGRVWSSVAWMPHRKSPQSFVEESMVTRRLNELQGDKVKMDASPYQIFLWITVVLVLFALGGACALFSMDFFRDPLLYSKFRPAQEAGRQ